MDDQYVEFLPFHAINDFMLDDYREQVIRSVLEAADQIPPDQLAVIDELTRKRINIPGFRNSAKAPVSLRLKESIKVFEKNPQMVASILTAWAELHSEFRQQVYDLLVRLEWEILPVDASRAQLPGFTPYWPFEQDFDSLFEAYSETYPESTTEQFDVSLMVVWLSMRLPYHKNDEEETEDDDDDEADEDEIS